jgi:hypothetical protein
MTPNIPPKNADRYIVRFLYQAIFASGDILKDDIFAFLTFQLKWEAVIFMGQPVVAVSKWMPLKITIFTAGSVRGLLRVYALRQQAPADFFYILPCCKDMRGLQGKRPEGQAAFSGLKVCHT